MNAEQLAAKLKAAAENFPPGARVWHVADGKRGVVVSYVVSGSGEVMVRVCFSAESNAAACYPYELSATKVSDGTDGEEWKDGREEADA